MPSNNGKPKKNQKREQTTLREVAAAAKVSEMTVSRVLRQTGNVSDKTRAKVLAVVDALGFVPNKIAGSLATSTSNLIAVIVPSLQNQVFTEVLAGLTSHLDQHGYKAVIGISDYDQDKEEELIRSMLSWRPSGFIVSNLSHTEQARRILKNAGIPLVEMMDTTAEPIDSSVGVDHYAAGALMAHHFMEKGYRRLGYLGWNKHDRTARKRFEGFNRVLAEYGMAFEGLMEFDRPPDIAIGKDGLFNLLIDHPDLEAVYFPNDVAAVGGLFHCLEAKINVPGSLAIGGFSGLQIGQLMPQPLTTVIVKRFEIGRRSAEHIVDRLNGKIVERISTIELKLAPGGTT
ncbi:LacI family DNA-binding transcriptional regulator CceR [Magnetospira thiophila]